MKLIVLGASGRCGGWAVQIARERSHEVTAVIRPDSLYEPPPGVALAEGEVLDPDFVSQVLVGHEAVISCVGQRRAGPSPWSKSLSPPDLVERVMTNVQEALQEDPSVTVCWLSAGGVGSSRAQATFPVRRLITLGNIGQTYEDLEAAEQLMSVSSVQSLAVRPVTLRPGPPAGRAAPVDRYGLLSTVRRADVAEWMIHISEHTRTFQGSSVLLGQAT